jgi:capsular polysaccharide biosynthesis protein
MFINQLPTIKFDEIFTNYSTNLRLNYSTIFTGNISLPYYGSEGLQCFTNYTGAKKRIPNFLIKIPDGIFVGGAFNIFSIKDSVKFHHYAIDHAYHQHDEWNGYFERNHNQLIPRDIHRLKGKTLLIKGTWSHAFYHFLTEALAKISIAKKEFDLSQFDKIIIGSPHSSYIKEWLIILGIDPSVVIDVPDNLPIVCDELYVPTYLQECGCCSLELISFLDESTKDKLKINISLEGYKKIYISRSGARKVINEGEVEKLLTSAGYKFLQLENFSINDQIFLFKNAQSVIAPHGAGLANLLFSNGEVLELAGDIYNNACYADICLNKKIDFRYISCKQSGSDLLAPTSLIEKFLQK